MRMPPSSVDSVTTSRCVVVLGSGRSGTSVTTQALVELGVRFNYDPSHRSDQNPEGMFEDEFIVAAHKRLFSEAQLPRDLPLPEGWTASPVARSLSTELEDYVAGEFGTTALWGFKDPRTSSLLPLWKRIFNRRRVLPRYVLCVRDPSAVVASQMMNYQTPQTDAELTWLSRNLAALQDTGLDCFILHYERLIAEPERVLGALAEHVFGQPAEPERIRAVVQKCIKASLNRSTINSVQLKNPLLSTLYAALMECEGTAFDRAGLAASVQQCAGVLNAVAPSMLKVRRNAQGEAPKADTGKAEAMKAELAAAKEEKNRMQTENAALREESTRLSAKVKALRVELESRTQQSAEHAQARERLETQVAALQSAQAESKRRHEAQQAAHAEAMAQVEAKLAAARAELAARNAEVATLRADLQDLVAQHNAGLKQIRTLHEQVDTLSVRAFASSEAPAAPAGKKEKAEKAAQAPAEEPARKERRAEGGAAEQGAQRRKREQPPRSRGARLWRKFRQDPYTFFSDSRYAPLRSLRHLVGRSA